MTRVDRYILFLFLRVLIVCFVCLAGLMIIIHAFSNLDELMNFGRARGSIAKGLMEYYGPFSLVLLDRFGGMLALLAVMFVVSWLRRTNEMVSLMAAGISPRRILIVPVIASVGFFVAMAINREAGIPRFEEMLGKNPQDLSSEHLRPVKPVYDGKYGVLFSGRNLSLAAREIKQPSFRLEGPAAVVGRQLQGLTAHYREADEQHPTGFLIEGVSVPVNIGSHPSVYHDSNPIVLTAHDQSWLQPNQCFIAANIEFEELLGGNAWMQYASTGLMIQRLRASEGSISDDLRLNIHQRFIQPLLDLTMLMLGIPILLKQQDRHLFAVAAAIIGTIGCFLLATKFFHSLASGTTVIPPYLGAWLPLLIFAPFAYARLQKAWLR